MATKSPLAKALKGNQGKLPQHLQDAIKAAPESPAKQTKNKPSITGKKRALEGVDPKTENPGTKKEVFMDKANKKRYK